MKHIYRGIIFFAVCLALNQSCSSPKGINPLALNQENACVQSLQVGDYDAAETRCQLCLEYDENVPECINGLGLVALGRNDSDTAIKYFTQAISKSKNFAQARNNLGVVHFRKYEYEAALPFFKAAIEIDPGYLDARYNLGLTYLRVGQKLTGQQDFVNAKTNYDLALGQYQKVAALNPSFANAYRDQGLIMTYLAAAEKHPDRMHQELQEALRFFSQCLRVEPTNEGCLESDGHTLLYLNQFDQALYAFVQCLALNKKNPVCIQGMDAAYQGSQMKTGALSQYIDRIKANPQDAQGHYGYCAALFENGMNDMGVSECETAAKLDSKLCLAYYSLAMYYKKVLNSKSAFQNCQSYLLCNVGRGEPDKLAQCQRIITTLSGQ